MKLANHFNNYWNTNYCTNNTSNNVALLHAVYFVATAVALSIFRPTHKHVTHYFNQLAKPVC